MAERVYEVGDIVKMKKKSTMRELRVGDSPGRSGFPTEMHRLWTPDHDCKEAGRKKYERTEKKLEIAWVL